MAEGYGSGTLEGASKEEMEVNAQQETEGSVKQEAQQPSGGFFLPCPFATDKERNAYKKFEVLGKGSHGRVYRGYSVAMNCDVAMKEVDRQQGIPATALREAATMKMLKHSNIVTVYEIVFLKSTMTFILEYMDFDLMQVLKGAPNGLPVEEARLLLFQLLRGIQYCHQKHILHRDLKPRNLLVNTHGELKIADFGLARWTSVPCFEYSSKVVTLAYRAPEILLGSTDYGASVDMWSVGCIFAEMICGSRLFQPKGVLSQHHLIFSALGTPTEESWPGVTSLPKFYGKKYPVNRAIGLEKVAPKLKTNDDVLDICKGLVQLHPDSRLKASDAMKHEFFSCLPAQLFELPAEKSILSMEKRFRK